MFHIRTTSSMMYRPPRLCTWHPRAPVYIPYIGMCTFIRDRIARRLFTPVGKHPPAKANGAPRYHARLLFQFNSSAESTIHYHERHYSRAWRKQAPPRSFYILSASDVSFLPLSLLSILPPTDIHSSLYYLKSFSFFFRSTRTGLYYCYDYTLSSISRRKAANSIL